MLNKYHIGDRIQYIDDHGNTAVGIIHEIKTLSHRFNPTKNYQGHSEIIPGTIGYKCYGSLSRISETNIVSVLATDQLK